ncbi:glycosyltransferase [Rhizobium paranaense]|nr:glycosyltransferase family 2 protein [Rhizobium paranaense]
MDRLRQALAGISWEVVFVDDDSKDGTIDFIRRLALRDHRICGIRRIGRRGLAGACMEGILSSSAPIVAVMDADLQHDERRLAEMLAILKSGEADLVVATRFDDGGGANGGLSRIRHLGSRLAIRLAQILLGVVLTDPMSGFFMTRREIVERVAPRLSQHGFKILLDIVASSPAAIRTEEVPFTFPPRLHGESKLDASVVTEYLGLVVAKASGDLISARFLLFGLVGFCGVIVHLTVLYLLLRQELSFVVAQTGAMLGAMLFNFTLNNALTYRDRRRRGWRFVTGLILFASLCSVGVIAGVGVSAALYQDSPQWWLDGIAGALVGALWNYVTNSAITWRAH